MAFSKLAVLALVALRSATVLAEPDVRFSTSFFDNFEDRILIANQVKSTIELTVTNNYDYAITHVSIVGKISSRDGDVSQTFGKSDLSKRISGRSSTDIEYTFTPHLRAAGMEFPAPVEFSLQALVKDEYGYDHTYQIFYTPSRSTIKPGAKQASFSVG